MSGGAESFDDNWKAAPGPLDTPCHLWQRSTYGFGYGRLSVNGRTVGAHRFAWERVNGLVPKGLILLHRCDTPRCVNPEHLRLGTHTDNMRDASSKRRLRHQRGAEHHRAKLNDTDIERIRDLRSSGCTQFEIARWFSVSRSLISMILSGRRWAHRHRAVRCPEYRGGSGSNRGAVRYRG